MEILKNTGERLRRRMRRHTEITVMEHGDRGGRKRDYCGNWRLQIVKK
jgi:hypothetical protein